jgi:hypothetical protein
METDSTLSPTDDAGEPEIVKHGPIKTFLLLDVVSDRDSWPVIGWAMFTLLIGMLFYHLVEGWSWLDSAYFCVVSLATVGYGDLSPDTPLARLFTIIYLVNGIGILLALFDRIRLVRTQTVKKRLAHRRRRFGRREAR